MTKITEYTPTPEYMYHNHVKDRQDALRLAAMYATQYDKQIGVLMYNKTLTRKQRQSIWWSAQCLRELSVKAIQLASQHERAAYTIEEATIEDAAMINLPRMHRMVWTFREDTQAVFPVPNQQDSLRFAVTEAAEALDAHLRNNGEYKRNRDKAHSEERELAQCLMMLFTAYGPRPYFGEWWPDENVAIDDACYAVALAHKYGGTEIVNAIRTVCQYVGPDIEDELAQALDALRAKHLGVTPVTEVAA